MDASDFVSLTDTSQKRERGIIWKVDNGLKALKVGGICLMPARITV